MLLEGRKLLITGVLTDKSIAFTVARRAQDEGAEIVLTGFGRGMRITERMAKRLPTEAEVLELDVNDPDQLEAVAGTLDERWGRLDGAAARDRLRPRRRAGRQVPGDAERLGGRRLRDERVLAEGPGGGDAAAARARRGGGRRRPGLRRQRRVAGLRLGRRLQGSARVDQSLPRARPRPPRRALEPRRRRPAADRGGARTSRASTASREIWERQAPLGWDLRTRRRSRTRASSCCRRWRGRSRARSCTSTAACMRIGAAPMPAADASSADAESSADAG